MRGRRERRGRSANSGELVQRYERQSVVRIHRNHELIRTGVVAHRRGIRDVLRNEFGSLARTNTGNTTILDAAHVLYAIGHDHKAIIARLYSLFGPDELARWRESQDFFVADVDHYDVALRVECDPVGLSQRRSLNKDGRGAVRCNLPDLP